MCCVLIAIGYSAHVFLHAPAYIPVAHRLDAAVLLFIITLVVMWVAHVIHVARSISDYVPLQKQVNNLLHRFPWDAAEVTSEAEGKPPGRVILAEHGVCRVRFTPTGYPASLPLSAVLPQLRAVGIPPS